MTRDVVILRAWLTVALLYASVGVNAVPLVYAFSPWRTSRLGKLFMFQAASFAFAIDITILFQFWRPKDVLIIFWSGLALYTLIGSSTSALAWLIWRLNRPRKRKKVCVMVLAGPVYDFLKRAAQIYIPALGTLYFALAQIWNLPSAEDVVGTVVAVDTFLGVVLGISSKTYNDSDAKYAGTMVIEDHPDGDGSTVRLQSVDPVALATRPEIIFKVIKQ